MKNFHEFWCSDYTFEPTQDTFVCRPTDRGHKLIASHWNKWSSGVVSHCLPCALILSQNKDWDPLPFDQLETQYYSTPDLQKGLSLPTLLKSLTNTPLLKCECLFNVLIMFIVIIRKMGLDEQLQNEVNQTLNETWTKRNAYLCAFGCVCLCMHKKTRTW